MGEGEVAWSVMRSIWTLAYTIILKRNEPKMSEMNQK